MNPFFHCEFNSDLRFDLFAKPKNIEVNFKDFNENDKLYFLMNNSNVQDIEQNYNYTLNLLEKKLRVIVYQTGS